MAQSVTSANDIDNSTRVLKINKLHLQNITKTTEMHAQYVYV